MSWISGMLKIAFQQSCEVSLVTFWGSLANRGDCYMAMHIYADGKIL